MEDLPQRQQAPRRRRRPAVSCVLCRRRKIRCNRETPCSNCVRSKTDTCVYDNVPNTISSLQGPPSTGDTFSGVESMKSRIRELEEQVQRVAALGQPTTTQSTHSTATPSSQATSAPTRIGRIFGAASDFGGAFYIHHGDPALGQRSDINRSVTHKKRMFGQSHWINSALVLCDDLVALVEEFSRDDRSNIVSGLKRCKQVGRQIKSQRTPSWPCSPTPELPPKAIADKLLEGYMRTSESLYRVLHIPSFLTQYETIWTDSTEVDPTFLVLLKLVFAIGAATYNDKFTLRPSAIRWVYEAEAWLANPTLKHRLGLQYFQIYCLLLIAREAVAVGEDLVWISTGGLFRAAVHMGLHRDPVHLPPRTVFANEMHRRLWNTIIELCLQTSLNHGGPPLISVDDFDTQPPSNLDDEQLTNKDPVPKPESDITQASIAIALRRTFTSRLHITKFLNCIGSTGSYEETLRLDTEFRQSCRQARTTFQVFGYTATLTDFQIALSLVNVILERYLVALHMPFFTSSLNDNSHTFSRKVALDSSLKIWYIMHPSMSASPESSANTDYIERLGTCASGFIRISILQSMFVVAVELREKLKEDEGLGPVPLRPDLLAIVENAVVWQFKCIEAGETNIKGYIFTTLISASIEGLMKGLNRDALASFLIEHVHEAEEQCIVILRNMLDQLNPDRNVDSLGQIPLDTTPISLEGWDFMLPGMGLDDGSVDPMAWMFDQRSAQGGFPW
ncbi:hypothetical protein P280DRAFT_544881 [Massarina eburnea CBS 473.64]|uniref:Zn(2)-C6 fungal-type domain-containing protein n=1 Tax=Massarina eburnea CBS 473.64 TaxID=1395130 RepID=A0A6A6SF56_9PLEO|nr:hypothetical protein P280DRAFT_544881 [Massarina eburnea CBS 473.64]